MQAIFLITTIQIDVVLNAAITLQIDAGKIFSKYDTGASLVNESIVRSVEIVIIFQIFGQTNNTFALFGTMFFEWTKLALQTLFKVSETAFVRSFSNFSIFLAVRICWYLADTSHNGFNLADNPFVIWSLAISIIQSIIDGLNFPD